MAVAAARPLMAPGRGFQLCLGCGRSPDQSTVHLLHIPPFVHPHAPEGMCAASPVLHDL
jgi:hypothetical protein